MQCLPYMMGKCQNGKSLKEIFDFQGHNAEQKLESEVQSLEHTQWNFWSMRTLF